MTKIIQNIIVTFFDMVISGVFILYGHSSQHAKNNLKKK